MCAGRRPDGRAAHETEGLDGCEARLGVGVAETLHDRLERVRGAARCAVWDESAGLFLLEREREGGREGERKRCVRA